MHLLRYLSGRSKPILLALIFALVALVGVGDYLTIPPFSFELFYFVPILLAGWFAGRLAGILTAAACALASFLADLLPAVYGDPALPYWNAGVRLVVFLILAQIVTTLEHLSSQQEAERIAALKRTDELKTALLQAVSHDLRTPLASIKTSATSLLDTSVSWNPLDNHALLKGIDQECDRLNRLVGNLLDMSRIEGGILHLECDWYSIDEVLHSALHRLRPSLAAHPIQLDIPDNLPLIMIDFVRIEQVLTNLIENAVNYTPAGTPIRVSARNQSWNGEGVIRVTVSDEGSGVAPQHLVGLFDRFYRVSGTGQPHNAGLGLSITKGVVQAHGGQIEAQSSPGRGLSVSFTLPIASGTRDTLSTLAVGKLPKHERDKSGAMARKRYAK
jgi:K+-sensing histidine kinase KdpD